MTVEETPISTSARVAGVALHLAVKWYQLVVGSTNKHGGFDMKLPCFFMLLPLEHGNNSPFCIGRFSSDSSKGFRCSKSRYRLNFI